MLTVTYRKKGILCSHIWFATEEEIQKGYYRKNCGDIIFLHGTNSYPVGGVLYTQQKTLIKDLKIDKEELFSSLGKHLRQYIKRSQKDAQIIISFYESKDINVELLDKCKDLYEKMYRDKGMKSKFNLSLAMKYQELNSLIIGAAFENGSLVGFSAIIHDDNNARLWIAAFDFRDNQADSQLLSRAHQRLDWELLLLCKEKGITTFDFGGVNSFTDPNGIAKFKMNFEKNNFVEYSNYLIPNSMFGRIAMKMFLH